IYVSPACSTAKSITMPDSNNHIGGLSPVKLIGIMNDSLSKSGATAKFLYDGFFEKFFFAEIVL
ncbi:MAG: hypothetical protein IKD09_05050, partial [Lentisphaeria bacterium]|nr:hypothetical protein [Lentisphaeria bacterium]